LLNKVARASSGSEDRRPAPASGPLPSLLSFFSVSFSPPFQNTLLRYKAAAPAVSFSLFLLCLEFHPLLRRRAALPAACTGKNSRFFLSSFPLPSVMVMSYVSPPYSSRFRLVAPLHSVGNFLPADPLSTLPVFTRTSKIWFTPKFHAPRAPPGPRETRTRAVPPPSLFF